MIGRYSYDVSVNINRDLNLILLVNQIHNKKNVVLARYWIWSFGEHIYTTKNATLKECLPRISSHPLPPLLRFMVEAIRFPIHLGNPWVSNSIVVLFVIPIWVIFIVMGFNYHTLTFSFRKWFRAKLPRWYNNCDELNKGTLLSAPGCSFAFCFEITKRNSTPLWFPLVPSGSLWFPLVPSGGGSDWCFSFDFRLRFSFFV